MKKILVLILIFLINSSLQTYAVSSAVNTVQEKESVLNCEKGDKILLYYETLCNQGNVENPDRYLNSAKYYYYQASKQNLSNANALIGQARVSLYKNKIRDAKSKLFVALNYDELNPKTNFYLGEAFFKEGIYSHAIRYYRQAYTNGYANDYKTNFKIGICYEKMNENMKARMHYQIALSINPDCEDAKQRLEAMDNVKTNFQNFDTYHARQSEIEFMESVTDEEIQNLQEVMH